MLPPKGADRLALALAPKLLDAEPIKCDDGFAEANSNVILLSRRRSIPALTPQGDRFVCDIALCSRFNSMFDIWEDLFDFFYLD